MGPKLNGVAAMCLTFVDLAEEIHGLDHSFGTHVHQKYRPDGWISVPDEHLAIRIHLFWSKVYVFPSAMVDYQSASVNWAISHGSTLRGAAK